MLLLNQRALAGLLRREIENESHTKLLVDHSDQALIRNQVTRRSWSDSVSHDQTYWRGARRPRV